MTLEKSQAPKRKSWNNNPNKSLTYLSKQDPRQNDKTIHDPSIGYSRIENQTNMNRFNNSTLNCNFRTFPTDHINKNYNTQNILYLIFPRSSSAAFIWAFNISVCILTSCLLSFIAVSSSRRLSSRVSTSLARSYNWSRSLLISSFSMFSSTIKSWRFAVIFFSSLSELSLWRLSSPKETWRDFQIIIITFNLSICSLNQILLIY